MSDVTFGHDYRWDGARWAMAFHAEHEGNVILCLISFEALQDWFDARADRHGREEAFLQHRKAIEEKAKESILKGEFDSAGNVLLVTRHFSSNVVPGSVVLATSP